MHEASIAQGILDVALGALPDPHPKITRIVLVAGVLAGVEKECLTAYFDELARGTAAEGASIEIKREPASLICRTCGAITEYNGAGPVEVTCARCGGPNGLQGGGALYVDSLEIES